ncbi:Lacal_2735 family protein [Psychroserpens sp. XS_ASV72]|uniref:Lacal_2735 family protein n=1 Tax=Psychroserpens sp. XS_ASV72 TaxID=3241293 RepID=UPI0035158D6B
MNTITKLDDRQSKLQLRYKQLMEQAYNFRQTDSAFSDISEYNAIKLLNKMNKLNFLSREKKK